jgi:hypothetical protein
MANGYPQIDDAMRRLAFKEIEPHGPLPTRDTILDRAAALAVAAPDDYLYFLTTYGPGAFSTTAVIDLPAGNPLGKVFMVDILYGPGGREDWDPFELCESTYEGVLPDGMLPIATDPGGNLLVLDASGHTFAWDHEHRELAPDALDRIDADLRNANVDTSEYDVGQLIQIWESMFPDRVTNPTGHGNLYQVADTFSAFCAALRAMD